MIATEDDIPRIVEWGRQFHAASPYRALPYAPESVAAAVRSLMEGGIVLISDKGMAAAMMGPLWFSDGLAAQECFWWGDASLRQGLEDWARSRGCSTFSMICLENEKAPVMARLYRTQGYQPCEHHFMKAL